ncbi:MAG: hypothetical protein ACXVAO_03010, partial [Vulcanimicrobiaceae bacterium]
MTMLVSACASQPSPGSQRALLDASSSELQYQYHAWVPLGWAPVAIAGTYYPGYVASLQGYAEYLDAIWRGRIEADDVQKPRVREVFEVLNHLAKVALLVRKHTAEDSIITSRWRRYRTT